MGEIVKFDYASLPQGFAPEVQAAAERIRVRMSRTAQDIIEIGLDLIQVKGQLQHGQWLPWLQAEFGMTDQTARNFMNVADRFAGKSKAVLDFSPKALYLLAAPSTPDDVVDEAVKAAERGEDVSAKKIKELREQLQKKTEKIKDLKDQKKDLSTYLEKMNIEFMEKNNYVERLKEHLENAKNDIQKLTSGNVININTDGEIIDLIDEYKLLKEWFEQSWFLLPLEVKQWARQVVVGRDYP